MTPQALVLALESRGVRLKANGSGLVVKPVNRVAPAELEALRAAKPAVLDFLRSRDSKPSPGIEATSLYRLEKTLVVDVPRLGGSLYITPSCREAEDLRASAPKPCVVFCRCRVIDLILAGATKTEAHAVLEAALLFDGTISGVRVQ